MRYSISNKISGQDLGTYEGKTANDAVEAMARDAGYRSYASLCEDVGGDKSELHVEVAESVPDLD